MDKIINTENLQIAWFNVDSQNKPIWYIWDSSNLEYLTENFSLSRFWKNALKFDEKQKAKNFLSWFSAKKDCQKEKPMSLLEKVKAKEQELRNADFDAEWEHLLNLVEKTEKEIVLECNLRKRIYRVYPTYTMINDYMNWAQAEGFKVSEDAYDSAVILTW